MYCSQCGNSIPDDSTFCFQCGRQVSAGSPPDTSVSRQTGGSRRSRLIACIVVSLVAMLLFHDLAGLFAIGIIGVFFYFREIRLPVPYKLALMAVFAVATSILQLLYIHNEAVSHSGDRTQSTAQPEVQKPYVLPAEFSLEPLAQRGTQGEIYISGKTNFPDGMKMWVILGPKKAQQDAFVKGGQFRSGALYQGVPTPMTGNQPLEVVAYFNTAWQSKDVLAALGERGKNLQGKLFKLTDPDVIDSEKILDAKFTVSLPPPAPLSAETNAINIVKHAILTVPGNGRSATDIEESLKLFMTPGTGVSAAKGWSATAAGPNLYDVSFDFNDGSNGEKQAIWSANTATKQVKYVNEAAKLFSWAPNY